MKSSLILNKVASFMRISRESEKLSPIRRQFFDRYNATRAIEQYFHFLWSIYLKEQATKIFTFM